MTPTQVRLRIVELRSQLISGRLLSPEEERATLVEIEGLRKQLETLEGPRGRAKIRQELEALVRGAGLDPVHRVNAPQHEGKISAQERRRHPRFPVAVPIRYSIAMLPGPEALASGASRDAAHAKGADISRGGILCYTKVPVPVGSRVELLIPSTGGSAREEKIKVAGEVVRRTLRDDETYAVGVRFLRPKELPPEWITRLRFTYSTEREK